MNHRRHIDGFDGHESEAPAASGFELLRWRLRDFMRDSSALIVTLMFALGFVAGANALLALIGFLGLLSARP